MYESSRIITCSLDGHIKIWGSPNNIQLPSVFRHEKSNNTKEALLVRRDNNEPLVAQILGDLTIHSEGITKIVGLSSSEFVSCGNDGMVILWKDGRIQNELRNFRAYENMRQHKVEGFQDIREDPVNEEESTVEELDVIHSKDDIDINQQIFIPRLKSIDKSEYTEPQKRFIDKLIELKETTATGRESLGLPFGQGGRFGLPVVTHGNNFPVPQHTLDYAHILQLEKKNSTIQVCGILRELGYSETFVRYTRKKL